MSINGKRNDFAREDLIAVGESIGIPKAAEIINEVIDSVKSWPEFAKKAGVAAKHIAEIARHHRLDL